MLKLVAQPKGSVLCGQSVVATIAGITLEEAIDAFDGYTGKTKSWHLIKAFKSLGIKTDGRLTIIPPNHREGWCSKLVCVAYYFDKVNKIEHFMVVDHGKILDPAGRHTGKKLTDPTIAPHVKSTLAIRGVH